MQRNVCEQLGLRTSFDATCAGDSGDNRASGLDIPPGQYDVLSKMFEPGFEARLLCGGFSGSAVVMITPEAGDPAVVKLDKASSVKDEAERTKLLMDLTGSNAPNLLGDPVVRGEHGGLKLELVGSCGRALLVKEICT